MSHANMKFLEQVFRNMYGEKFERLKLSINSRGIEEDNNGGFIVAVDIAGTSDFQSETNITSKEVMEVLKDSFRKYNDLFLEILADQMGIEMIAIGHIEGEVFRA